MTDATVIAALRLAVEASADDKTLRALVAELLSKAPSSEPSATEPVDLLLDAIRAVNAEMVVAG